MYKVPDILSEDYEKAILDEAKSIFVDYSSSVDAIGPCLSNKVYLKMVGRGLRPMIVINCGDISCSECILNVYNLIDFVEKEGC